MAYLSWEDAHIIAKRIRDAALSTCGTSTTGDRINAENQLADLHHEPDSARDVERAQLGLLGRIAARPCLIEVYNDPLGPDELRACLSKHLACWRQRTRANPADEPPFLWILSAGALKGLLATLPFEPVPDWPAGIYQFGGDVLRVRLVIVGELPREPTTLLVRVMAGGPLIPSAVRELAALPAGTPARTIAEPVLLRFQQALEQAPDLLPDEEEFITAVSESLGGRS